MLRERAEAPVSAPAPLCYTPLFKHQIYSDILVVIASWRCVKTYHRMTVIGVQLHLYQSSMVTAGYHLHTI